MDTPVDRVRALIAGSQLTQAAYAEAVGLDPTKLSKSLSGARRFSSLDLARIAEFSHVSVDWLLTGVEPTLATAARAGVGSSATTALGLASQLVELRESATRLGFPQERRPLPTRTRRSRAVDQGSDLAEEALARVAALGLDVVTLDLAGLIETAFGIDVALRPLGSGFDGLAVATPEAAIILASVSAVPYRQRFTVAHELGHLLNGDNQGIHADADIFSKESKRGESEMRANAFAAAFLMPSTVLRGSVGPGFSDEDFARLSLRLMVSPSALAYRLENLRLIDAMARDRWLAMSAKEAARLAGRPETIGAATAYSSDPRIPGLLARDLFAAYLEDKTTLRPYANLIGVDAAQLRDDLERSHPGD